MNRIDYLVEKYALAFKHRGHTWEVYEDPSPREIKEADRTGDFRFIADAREKKVYVFNQDIYHSVTWNENIKEMTKDNRWIYKDPTLFAGSVESGDVMNWGFNDVYYTKSVVAAWLKNPKMFDFANKYKINITKWMEENEPDMERYKDYEGAAP